VKTKLGVLMKFIILNIWSLCIVWLLLKAITCLLETFKCHNKLSMFGFPFIFLGFLKMSSKFMVCSLFKRSLSFMFDDFDTVSFAPRHICLQCIMLNTKNGNTRCFLNAYLVLSKFQRCLTCNRSDTLTTLFAISGTPNPKGNSVGNIHEIKFEILYSLINLDLWLYDKYWFFCKLLYTLVICSCWSISIPSKSINHDVSMTFSLSLTFFSSCKFVMFVWCSAPAT
jgi:hypothetical protein